MAVRQNVQRDEYKNTESETDRRVQIERVTIKRDIERPFCIFVKVTPLLNGLGGYSKFLLR
jgi:hypothetical protein